MTKRMIIMLIGVIVVFGLVFGAKWAGNKIMVDYISNMPVPTVTITAGPAQRMSWSNQLDAIGTLVPVNGTEVTTESGGIVTAIHFESGDQVKKGARLVMLDGANELGEYRRLQAQAELAELNLKRRERLYKLEAISKADYDAAVAEANAAKAAAEGQAGRAAQKDIRAPFDGRLGIRRVNLGQYVAPGTAIVTLQSLDPIDIDFSLPEQYGGRVEPGLQVSIQVDGYPDESFAGKVLAVEPRVDTATRNFMLRARLSNPDGKLRAGQFGRVRLNLQGEREVLVLPRTAVSYDSYGTSVYVVQRRKTDDKAKAAPAKEGEPQPPELEVVQRFIKLGDVRGDFVAVVDGLKENEQVATSGLLKLRNQQPVIVDNSQEMKSVLDPKPQES